MLLHSLSQQIACLVCRIQHYKNIKQEAQLMLTNPRDAFSGQSRSPNNTIPIARYSFLLCNSNFVFKRRRFYDIRLQKMSWPWNRGQRSLKVIEDDTIQSGTHDFLLTFHSNHRPISHRFRDKRLFRSKIARRSPIFPTPMYLAPPVKGFPLEFGIGAGVRRN